MSSLTLRQCSKLYQTDLLDLLPTLYGQITLPQTVATRPFHSPRCAEFGWGMTMMDRDRPTVSSN